MQQVLQQQYSVTGPSKEKDNLVEIEQLWTQDSQKTRKTITDKSIPNGVQESSSEKMDPRCHRSFE